MDARNYDEVFNSTTNWRIAGGSLTDSISFESSFSENHESADGIISSAAVAKSPLLLLPSIPDSEPCEITITFAQEHELRQIYIRSSARVYEVYYTKKARQDREYLCTVRCGIAMRPEEEVLQIPLTDSAASTNRVEPVKDNGNGRTSEDDWVEVKTADASLLNNELKKQDFFEATAEINDAEPCISITLRLLSLQKKECALVDEVYVYADPIDQSESEQEEASGAGNSSSSALMAMFMPTLLQLSRGKERARQTSDKPNSMRPRTLGNSNGSDEIMNEVQQEQNLSKAEHSGVSSLVLDDTLAKRVDPAKRVSEEEIKPSISCNNMDVILHQLVNKVSSIETTLLRFEEQMLKPINSIDARLQLVEKKLEQLGKKSSESECLPETKVVKTDSAVSDTDKSPDTDVLKGSMKYTDNLDCSVPDSSSINSSEDCGDVLLLENKLHKLVEPGSENNSISGNEMISAESEMINDEVGHSFGRGSLEEKPKTSLSINDALASALAGLLSSTSISDTKYSQALVVTAPEFSNEDDMDIEEKPQTGTHADKIQDAAEELGNAYSAPESPTSSHKQPESTLCTNDDSHKMIKRVSEKSDDSMGGDDDDDDDDDETAGNFRNDYIDEETVTSSRKADCCEPRNPDSLVHKAKDSNATSSCGMDDVLKSVLGFQPSNSLVNFQTPVLDVEFKSESNSKCFFEALFTAESKSVVDCENDEEDFEDQLVSMEDEELLGPPTDTLSSLEMHHYEANEIHLGLIAETPTTSLI